MHNYQIEAVKRIVDQEATGLFLEMGLGKTVIVLTAIKECQQKQGFKVLVIAPLRVASSTWYPELVKWEHLKGLTMSLVLGDRKQRSKKLAEKADIYVINRENVPWLVDYYSTRWPFGMVVIDELSSFKSADALRFRKLKKVRTLIKKIVGLTGTPAPNGLLDLWSQLWLLDMGERLGKSLTGFRNRYFIPGKGDPSRGIVYEWIPREGAHDKIYQLISDICISMKTEDWLELPERFDRVVEVRLGLVTLSKYEQFERDLILQMGEEAIVAGSAAVLSGKLHQYTQGAIYQEDTHWIHLHDAKLDMLQEMVEGTKTVIVYYWFRHDLERLLERFPGARVLKDDKDVQDWNAGRIKILLAHPASAGHGLNLQAGGSTIIWFSLTWSLELYQQANARLHRQGQTQAVIVHHLVVKGTLDEDIMAALANKTNSQEALMQAVKLRIERWCG